MFAKDNEFRALPAIADKAFRDRWEKLDRPVSANPSLRVAIFAGCVQDFVYPEQLEAAVKLMQGHNIRVDFPMDQSCCGLPVVMMGQRETARDVALQNMDAFEKGDYDVILTLCASCASQLKEGYVELFAGQPGVNSSPLPPTMFRLPKRKCAAVSAARTPPSSPKCPPRCFARSWTASRIPARPVWSWTAPAVCFRSAAARRRTARASR